MLRDVSISTIQSYVKDCSGNLSDHQIVKCSNYIKSLCSKYKAKFYSSLDKKIIFRLYDEGRRIRYLSFTFGSNNKLVTITYGTKRNNEKIGTYLVI